MSLIYRSFQSIKKQLITDKIIKIVKAPEPKFKLEHKFKLDFIKQPKTGIYYKKIKEVVPLENRF